MNFENGWFLDHFERVPAEISQFLSEGGINLNGKNIVDIGTGDGLIAAGLASISHDSKVTGLELSPVDEDKLFSSLSLETRNLISGKLKFDVIVDGKYKFEESSIDLVTSWSAAEHFMNPIRVFSEVYRILKSSGVFFLQTYPLWFSEHGHHLSTWIPPFWHLSHSRDELISYLDSFAVLPRPIDVSGYGLTDDVDIVMKNMGVDRRRLIELCLESYDSCNRLTLEQIANSIEASGLRIFRIEMLTNTVQIPSNLSHIGLNDLLTTGAKLLIVKP